MIVQYRNSYRILLGTEMSLEITACTSGPVGDHAKELLSVVSNRSNSSVQRGQNDACRVATMSQAP